MGTLLKKMVLGSCGRSCFVWMLRMPFCRYISSGFVVVEKNVSFST